MKFTFREIKFVVRFSYSKTLPRTCYCTIESRGVAAMLRRFKGSYAFPVKQAYKKDIAMRYALSTALREMAQARCLPPTEGVVREELFAQAARAYYDRRFTTGRSNWRPLSKTDHFAFIASAYTDTASKLAAVVDELADAGISASQSHGGSTGSGLSAVMVIDRRYAERLLLLNAISRYAVISTCDLAMSGRPMGERDRIAVGRI